MRHIYLLSILILAVSAPAIGASCANVSQARVGAAAGVIAPAEADARLGW